jgi:hypothetical protein
MRTINLPLPQFGFVVATRAALAAGIALMVADKLPQAHRRTVATVLVGIGALTTIPAAFWTSRSIRHSTSTVRQDPHLVGATRYPRKGDDIF